MHRYSTVVLVWLVLPHCNNVLLAYWYINDIGIVTYSIISYKMGALSNLREKVGPTHVCLQHLSVCYTIFDGSVLIVIRYPNSVPIAVMCTVVQLLPQMVDIERLCL
jgi:hypothetical protein